MEHCDLSFESVTEFMGHGPGLDEPCEGFITRIEAKETVSRYSDGLAVETIVGPRRKAPSPVPLFEPLSSARWRH